MKLRSLEIQGLTMNTGILYTCINSQEIRSCAHACVMKIQFYKNIIL